MTMTCMGRIPTSLIKETVEPEIDRRWALYDKTGDDTHLLAIDRLIKELVYYNATLVYAYKIGLYLDTRDCLKEVAKVDTLIFTREVEQYSETLNMTTDGTFYIEYYSPDGLIDDPNLPRENDEDDFAYRLRIAHMWAKDGMTVSSTISSDLDGLRRRLANYKNCDSSTFGRLELEHRIRLLKAVIKSLEKEDRND